MLNIRIIKSIIDFFIITKINLSYISIFYKNKIIFFLNNNFILNNKNIL